MKSLVALFTCLAVFPIASRADSKGADWVVKADKFRSPDVDYSIKVKVVDIDGSDKRENIFNVASKDNRLTLVEQIAPERQRGRKLLMRDHDLWLYSPNVSRPTRISFEQKLTGEVSNGDLMRTNFAQDYDAKVTGNETLPEGKTVKLHLTAKNKDVTYNSIDYWVNESNARPVKAVFYALSGKPLKTANYLEFKVQLGSPRLTKVQITDALQKTHQSVMYYASFKKEKFDDTYFSKESLSK